MKSRMLHGHVFDSVIDETGDSKIFHDFFQLLAQIENEPHFYDNELQDHMVYD